MKQIPVIVLLVCLTKAAVARAHEGPPYPVLTDEPVPGYLVSVWADPDIGTGAVYVITEPRGGETAAPHVDVWVQPVSERLPKATYPAERQDLRNNIQFVALPEFDQQEMWTVGIVIHPAQSDASELTVELEATPPGGGPWGLVIYLFPFLLFGGVWAIGLIRRGRATGQQAQRQPEPSHANAAGE